MSLVVEQAPGRNDLRRKTAVRERDDERRASAKHARALTKDLDRTGEVVDRHADGRAVEAGVAERQARLLIQIAHEPFRGARIRRQLFPIHPEQNHFALGGLRRQVTDPAAHEIEDRSTRRKVFAIELGDGGDGPVVDVRDEARTLVEEIVGRLVESREELRRKRQHGHPCRSPSACGLRVRVRFYSLTMRILVVEDERKVASFIRQGLQEDGHAAEIAADGAAALELVEAAPAYDLVILDLMLPKRDGFEVLKTLRQQRSQTPVLVLTARDSVSDKVRGLDLGADDYLTKPFAFDEFLARVRALLRRGAGQRAPVFKLDDLSLDPATRQVTRGSRRITLTAREYALLEYFLRNVGRVLTRPMIAQHVWGLDFDTESNIIDVYVGYLRRKIDGDGERRLLHTVRGAGYMLGLEA